MLACAPSRSATLRRVPEVRPLACVALSLLGSACLTASLPFQSRQDRRSLSCTRMDQAEAARLHPGEVPEPPVRGSNFSVTDALVCQRQILTEGEREGRDEAILSSLGLAVKELVQEASTLEGRPQAVWHVDAFYPDPRVASKISIAARTLLVEHGLRVSDRVPLLAAGDVAVITHQRLHQGYSTACARFFAEGTLTEQSVFLGLMIVDPRETSLHAGLCSGGVWKWLR